MVVSLVYFGSLQHRPGDDGMYWNDGRSGGDRLLFDPMCGMPIEVVTGVV